MICRKGFPCAPTHSFWRRAASSRSTRRRTSISRSSLGYIARPSAWGWLDMGVSVTRPSTFSQYKTLLMKDLKQEFRTKEMLTSMGIYALLVLRGVRSCACADGSGLRYPADERRSAVGAHRVHVASGFEPFVHARKKSKGALRESCLCRLDRSVVFLAKATSNLLFLLVVEIDHGAVVLLFLSDLHNALRTVSGS